MSPWLAAVLSPPPLPEGLTETPVSGIPRMIAMLILTQAVIDFWLVFLLKAVPVFLMVMALVKWLSDQWMQWRDR